MLRYTASRVRGAQLTRAMFATQSRAFGGQTKMEQQVEFGKMKASPPFDKVLIANRGEISVRVQNTCHKMGIKTVAVHSEADASGLFVSMADESVCIGPAASKESYLQIERIVNACKMTGAQAVHPGFGFLSENNVFAAALEAAGIVFIGPRSYAVEVMGDKILSKECAEKAQVNVIPGDNRVIKDVNECVEVSNMIGYPVMVKASAGGGGKGMRVAYDDAGCRDAFRLATNEAASAFGDDRLFVEKFIEEPRHVEIQVICDDHGNYVYLNERECSIQRRNQKVYEEAPSPVSTPALRELMGTQACLLAKAVDYITAGTVEFLVGADMSFYFLEMNTRLQVEHPVTEMITGIDLVEQMINVAAGQPLPFTQKDIGINGWALEARVYAEDPFKGFLPQTGVLSRYKEPLFGPNVRCDSGIIEGAEISMHYDPMISKLITWGEDRQAALDLMADALDSYVIHGLSTNIPFLRMVLENPRMQRGDLTTNFIPEEYPDGFDKKYLALSDMDTTHILAGAATTYARQRIELGDKNVELKLTLEDEVFNCVINDDESVTINDQKFAFTSGYSRGHGVFETELEGKHLILQLISKGTSDIVVQYKGVKYDVEVRTTKEEALQQFMPEPEVIDEARMLLAPMPGAMFSVNVKAGQTVVAGQEACVIEAMKMQNIFYVQKDGVVKDVYVKQGDTVQSGVKIYELE